MFYIHNSAVKAQANGITRPVQFGIIETSHNQGFRVMPLSNIGNQILYQGSSHTSIAIGKMINVRIVLVINCFWRKTHCTTTLSFGYRHQFGAKVSPVQSGMPSHSQYPWIINAKRFLQVIEIGMAIYVVL